MGKHRRTRREKNIKKDEDTGEWIVYKNFKKIGYHQYGTFKTFREAKKYRNYLNQKDNWVNELPNSKRVRLKKRGQGYFKSGNHYVVTKTTDHIQSFYGKYDNEEDAIRVVYELIANHYDWDSLPDEIKALQIIDDNMIYAPSNRYKVSLHSADGKNVNAGYYNTYNDAVKIRDWLLEHDWNINKLPLELKKLQVPIQEPQYFYYNITLKKFSVMKNIDGKTHYYGYYTTREEAQRIVQLLKENNWDKECLQNA